MNAHRYFRQFFPGYVPSTLSRFESWKKSRVSGKIDPNDVTFLCYFVNNARAGELLVEAWSFVSHRWVVVPSG
jgi:hypothetical protein